MRRGYYKAHDIDMREYGSAAELRRHLNTWSAEKRHKSKREVAGNETFNEELGLNHKHC